MSEEKKQPRGIRLTEDTFNKFKNIVEDLGGDQQQALAKLMEVYELEKGKEVLPEMRESIETFEGYVFAAVGMYRQVLEKCQDMKALVRTEYDTMLRSKDTVIQELQAQLETAKEIAKNTTAMEEKYKDLLKEAENTKAGLEEMLKKETETSKKAYHEWENKYATLESICTGLRSSESEAKEMVTSFMKENTLLKEEIQSKKEEYQKERTELKLKIRETETVAEEFNGKIILMQREFSEQKQQFEIFKATAAAELQLAVQKKENELNMVHKTEVKELQKELEKYRELYYRNIKTISDEIV